MYRVVRPASLRGVALFGKRQITSGRSFKILGVQQIAIGALDKKVLSDFWVGKLGIEKVSEYRSEVQCDISLFLFVCSLVLY